MKLVKDVVTGVAKREALPEGLVINDKNLLLVPLTSWDPLGPQRAPPALPPGHVGNRRTNSQFLPFNLLPAALTFSSRAVERSADDSISIMKSLIKHGGRPTME